MTVFGIAVTTLHGKAYELAEMINFCVAVAGAGLERRVENVFYDSNDCCCRFELCPSVESFDEVDTVLRKIARQTISQFEWNGTIDHGHGLDLTFLDGLSHSS
jgi:hypothetical protein